MPSKPTAPHANKHRISSYYNSLLFCFVDTTDRKEDCEAFDLPFILVIAQKDFVSGKPLLCFGCNFCPFITPSVISIRDHVYSHALHKFECETCDFQTYLQHKLFEHNLQKHGDSTYNYLCLTDNQIDYWNLSGYHLKKPTPTCNRMEDNLPQPIISSSLLGKYSEQLEASITSDPEFRKQPSNSNGKYARYFGANGLLMLNHYKIAFLVSYNKTVF